TIYKYYQTNKNNALFSYGILVYGDIRSVEDIISKVYGHLTYDTSKAPALKIVDLTAYGTQDIDNFIPQPWIVNEVLVQAERNAQIWSCSTNFNNFYRLPYVITAEEATE